MGVATVKVACCLPNGLTLEVGKPTVLANGELSSTYKTVDLLGTIKAGRSAVTFPDRKGLKFGITIVNAEVWNAWLAKNKSLRYVVDKSVFVTT